MNKKVVWVPTPTFLYRNYLYHKIITKLPRSYRFLLIGTGSGYFLKILQKEGFQGTAIDISSESVSCVKKILDKNKILVKKGDILNYQSKEKFDLVFSFEVIEHIKNDHNALSNMHKLLKPGGKLIFSVPAHMKAWGRMDEIGGHFRRYEKKSLTKLLLKCGFTIESFWSYGFPFLNIIQRFSKTGMFVKNFNHGISVNERTKKSGIRTDADPRFSFLYSNKVLLYPFFLIMNFFVKTDLGFGYLVIAEKKVDVNLSNLLKSIHKNYAVFNDEVLDVKGRTMIARQIIKVISIYRNNVIKPSSMKLLDIGCSSGIITGYLSKEYGQVVGIDVDEESINSAKSKFQNKNLNFLVKDGSKTGFADSSFDVIIANQIYYCFLKPKDFFDEVHRLLKPGGICYFGGRNKYTLWDAQYKLPLLSVMPRNLSDFIVKITGRSEKFEAEYKTYWQLEKMCNKFIVEKITPKAIHNYKKYGFEKFKKYRLLFSLIPEFAWAILEPILPNFVWILKKKY